MCCSEWLKRLGIAIVISSGIGAPSYADDLGTIGPVYAIAEPDLLQSLLARLREAETSGQIAALQDTARRRIEAAIADPPPVAGISRAARARHFYWDPTIVVKAPVLDANGRVLVAPGTSLNPLDYVSLSIPLLFIDARDEAQVSAANTRLTEHSGRLKLILTGGSWQVLSKQLQRPVFYDQQGTLSRRFGISGVPALVTQEGRRLRIDEGL